MSESDRVESLANMLVELARGWSGVPQEQREELARVSPWIASKVADLAPHAVAQESA